MLVAVGRHDLSLKICDLRLCAFVEEPPVYVAGGYKPAEAGGGMGDKEREYEKEDDEDVSNADNAAMTELEGGEQEHEHEQGQGQGHGQRQGQGQGQGQRQPTLLSDFVGSPGFFAPEILLQRAYHGFQADVWSIGCVALELLVRPAFFSATWLAAYNTLHTQHAPDFPRKLKNATKAAVEEVHEVRCICMTYAQHMQQHVCVIL